MSPVGHSGKKWRYKVKGDGLNKVILKDRSPAETDVLAVTVKSKGWFSAAAANEAVANTRLVIALGRQCFSLVATAKVD